MRTIAWLRGLFTPSQASLEKRPHQVATSNVQKRFKEAVREGDVDVIEGMFNASEISITDELDRGRGLLQFAVMANGVKSARLLMAMGADPTSPDSLGASAQTLSRKHGSEGMLRALADTRSNQSPA